MIEVLRSGLCDLVMDSGRPGYGALGVPTGGAADPCALEAANTLVGNAAGAAGLEFALTGPDLRFPQGAVAALTGAAFSAIRSSGAPVPWNETLVLAPGETLFLNHAIAGCRCWLAVQGGISVPLIMESRSTFLPSGFGGYQGRALRDGDVLPLGPQTGEVRLLCAQPPKAFADDVVLRVVAGPQMECFHDGGLAAFFTHRYHVAAASDRRGVRLKGASVEIFGAASESQGVMPGVIQIPPDGQPIIFGMGWPSHGRISDYRRRHFCRLGSSGPIENRCFGAF